MTAKTAYVILTSPHSLCDKNSGYDPNKIYTYNFRMCDNEARPAIESLGRKISEYNYNHVLIESDVIRSTRDLNRPWGEDDPFWKQSLRPAIDDVIKEHDNPIFLLDIHSFPDMDNISHLPLFIIDRTYAHNNPKYPSPYVIHLRDFLIKNGVETKIEKGSDVNAIIEYALGKGLNSLLIEFNERLSPSELDRLTTLIAQWLHYEIEHPKEIEDFIYQSKEDIDLPPMTRENMSPLSYNYVINRPKGTGETMSPLSYNYDINLLKRNDDIKPKSYYYFY